MNQTTFEELINDSGLLNKDTLSELEELLKEYPFCQTFHLLYAKNLYQQKHIRYNQQLKVAAAVVGDRTRLKHYIENTDFIVDTVKEQFASPIESTPVSIEERVPEIIEVPFVAEPENISHDEEEVIEVPDTEIKEDANPTLHPTETIHQPEDDKPKSSQPEEWDNESESILLTSLDTSISREEKKKAIIALINKKFSARKVETEETITEKETEESDTVVPPEIKKEEIIYGSEEIIEEQKVSTEEVSDLSVDSAPAIDLSVDSSIESADLDYLEGFAVTNDPELTEVQIPVAEKKEVTASDVLIENFLRDAPRMSRPKKEFFNPVNLAARSVVENEDFYTETYAAICLKQGNVSKAIKIYEKLSLKFPEKSSYFAGLIEKIKKEQNI
jgi:hypothetical protein